jgi:pimeloyl-ACP methyl ester carboxylesterase
MERAIMNAPVVSAPTVPQLNYARRRSGSPLALLHGIGHHWRTWDPVLARLTANHDVIAANLPGFGKAPLLLPDAYHVDLQDCGHVPMSDAANWLASTILATTREARA